MYSTRQFATSLAGILPPQKLEFYSPTLRAKFSDVDATGTCCKDEAIPVKEEGEGDDELGESSARRILRRVGDYVAATPNSSIQSIRRAVLHRVAADDDLPEILHSQWRHRPRRCNHHIELSI